MAEPGYQPDGSYVPCPECGCPPPPSHEGPGIPVTTGFTLIHRGDCSTVSIPPEVAEKLRKDLIEMDRCRARAAVEARNFVIY